MSESKQTRQAAIVPQVPSQRRANEPQQQPIVDRDGPRRLQVFPRFVFVGFNHRALFADNALLSVGDYPVKVLISLLMAAALTGCAQIQALRSNDGQQSASSGQGPAKLVDIAIPADALGARDPHLTEVLVKVGTVAAKQQPSRIVIAALPQDFPYLNQSVKRGIGSARAGAVQIENVTVGSCHPYSVQVVPTE